MLVPPEATNPLILAENPTIFSWVTVLRGQMRLPVLLKVMSESLSDGVSVSMRNLRVSRTSYIFWPLIDPLTSITQIRSTLVRVPPLAVIEHIAGRTVFSWSLTWERCAFKEIYNFASEAVISLALSWKTWSSLNRPCCSCGTEISLVPNP
jgi:hypothetical protein